MSLKIKVNLLSLMTTCRQSQFAVSLLKQRCAWSTFIARHFAEVPRSILIWHRSCLFENGRAATGPASVISRESWSGSP